MIWPIAWRSALVSLAYVGGVEAIVLGNEPAPVSQGWSVRHLGWGLLAFVLALSDAKRLAWPRSEGRH